MNDNLPTPIDIENARAAVERALLSIRGILSGLDEVLSSILSADAALNKEKPNE